jgi:hypothetical protein
LRMKANADIAKKYPESPLNKPATADVC